MATKERPIISDKMVEEILKEVKDISAKGFEQQREIELKKFMKEQEQEEKKDNKFKDEEDLMRKEFKRVYDKLEKAEPGSPEYSKLLDNLNDIKRIIKGGY